MKNYLVFSFLLFVLSGRSQQSYYAVTVDGHMTFNNHSSYAYAIHLESRIKETSIFLHWNFAFGMDNKMNFYGKANALTMLYKSPGYWDSPTSYSSTSGNKAGGLLALVLAPVLCPVGISIYFPEKFPKTNFGFYCNPMVAEFWDTSKKINSWTVETGFKLIRKTSEKTAVYVQCGVSCVNNMLDYRGAGYMDGPHLGLSLGLVHLNNWED